MSAPDPVAALMKSGLPFQAAIASLVVKHNVWKLEATEFPWVSADGTDQFLDVVAVNGEFFLAIECKKVEGQILQFLRPQDLDEVDSTSKVRCGELLRHDDSHSDGGAALEIAWMEIQPASYASQYCVVATSQSGKRDLLETDARSLVYATDQLARDVRRRFHLDPRFLSLPIGFLSVLVTTARLCAPVIDPTDVDLSNGALRNPTIEMKPVPWVRFAKTFTSRHGPDLAERTVFVVDAMHFSDFLNKVSRKRPSFLSRLASRLPDVA